MFKKGISVYTGLKEYSLEQNLEYLKLAHSLGYEVIFSSAHISEATDEYQELQILIDKAYEYGMKLSLDVSRKVFEKLQDFNHLYALRLDYGFSKEEIVELSHTKPYKIEINASTITNKELEELINLGVNTNNLRASFNFYPKLYTGHSTNFVKEKIALFKKYGIELLIFIPSHVGLRPPMYEGLPTIESHRKLDLNLVVEEIKTLGVDEIAFGDAYASYDELNILKLHQTDYLIIPFVKVPNLPSALASNLEGVFQIRKDYNDLMLRSTTSRGKTPIASFNTIERKYGDVTLDNDLFLRYRGEINIITSPLPQDERVNVVGSVRLTENLISALKRGQKFIFGAEVND